MLKLTKFRAWMPVFVAAVKLRRSRRYLGQSTAVACNHCGGEPEREGQQLQHYPAAALAGGELAQEVPTEENCIKRNLKAFYTDFDSERERDILRSTLTVCVRRAGHGHPLALMDQEAGSAPGSPDLQKTNPVLIPSGVEKSFKSRRAFSKLPWLA